MIFHENRLLADDSHEISYLIFYRKLVQRLQNLSSAAVVIGAIRVNNIFAKYMACGPKKKKGQEHPNLLVELVFRVKSGPMN